MIRLVILRIVWDINSYPSQFGEPSPMLCLLDILVWLFRLKRGTEVSCHVTVEWLVCYSVHRGSNPCKAEKYFQLSLRLAPMLNNVTLILKSLHPMSITYSTLQYSQIR